MGKTQLQARTYSLPLARPWRSSKGSLHTRRGWLILLKDKAGITGYGDCCPLPEAGTETHSQAAILLRQLAQLPVEVLAEKLSQYRAGHPAVCCGISTALLDLRARQRHLPLRQILNKNASHKISLNAVAGTLIQVNSTQLEHLAYQGFSLVKLKVGIAEPKAELEKLHQLSNLLSPPIQLRLDANQAWKPRQAAYFIDGLQGLPVECVEEPLQTPTLANLEQLQDSTPIALAADESISSLGIQTLIEAGVVRRLVLKPMQLGGLQPIMEVAKRAQQAGMDCVITSAMESAAGIWSASQLTAAIDPMFPGLAHGLATSHWLKVNTGEPPVIIADKLTLPSTAGSGFYPHEYYSKP